MQFQPGAKHPAAKLKWADVRKIRKALARGEKQIVLALRYNVCEATIEHIHTGRTWRSVK